MLKHPREDHEWTRNFLKIGASFLGPAAAWVTKYIESRLKSLGVIHHTPVLINLFMIVQGCVLDYVDCDSSLFLRHFNAVDCLTFPVGGLPVYHGVCAEYHDMDLKFIGPCIILIVE